MDKNANLKIVYDIEVYPNFFCLVAKQLNKELWFRIRIDESSNLQKQCKLLDSFFRQNVTWVAFNQLHYDNVVLNYILQNYKKFNNVKLFLLSVKKFNDLVIDDNYDEIKSYKYSNIYFKGISIDLFLYWSKGLRISKKISLKSLGIGLKHHTLQELPYEPDTYLTIEEADKVFKYCDNDVLITELVYNDLYDTSNLKTGSIKLRYDVHAQTGLNCFSWDTPKIASETLALAFANKIGANAKDVKAFRYERPPVIKIGKLFTDVNINFQTDQLQKVWEKIQNSYDSVSEEFIFRCNETVIKISIGNGGIKCVSSF